MEDFHPKEIFEDQELKEKFYDSMFFDNVDNVDDFVSSLNLKKGKK